MRHLADQSAHGVARQPRIGVERHDIANVVGQTMGSPFRFHESGVGRAAQEPIQLVQLAALALPAEPMPFTVVPDPPPMEKQKAWTSGRGAMALIETSDS